MRKRSGLGGTGGIRLSPDLRIKYGTYGFNKGKRTGHANRSERLNLENFEERVTSANTQPGLFSSDFERSSMGVVAPLDINRAQLPQTRCNERIHVRDSMDTGREESLQAPPIVTVSVDMGMRSEDTTQRTARTGQNSL